MKQSKHDKQVARDALAANKETAANDKQTIKDEASAQVRYEHSTGMTGATGLSAATAATGASEQFDDWAEPDKPSWFDRTFRNKEGQ
jgi:hypothetical protein